MPLGRRGAGEPFPRGGGKQGEQTRGSLPYGAEPVGKKSSAPTASRLSSAPSVALRSLSSNP